MTKSLAVDSHRFEGALLGRSGNFLIGWARNLAHPENVVTIDLIGDGQCLGSVRAQLNLALDDLSFEIPIEAEGHGFVFNIEARDWQSIGRFEAFVTNEDYRLAGRVFSYQTAQLLPQVQSTFVEEDGGLRVSGWAWDTLDPDASQTIYFYEAGRLVAEIIANQYSAELAEANCGNANHGFSLSLPMALADGCVHEIKAMTALGQVLKGSPMTIIAPATDLITWANSLALSQADQRLLGTLMDRYSWYVPTSVDFSSYLEWSDRFGSASHHSGVTTSVLVCISGDGDVDNTLKSLISQSHSQWTALVDGKPGALTDNRIHFVLASQWLTQVQQNIGKTGGIVSFIEAGDSLAKEALTSVVEAFENTAVQIAYSDCDQILIDGQPPLPWFKPDWDPDLFLARTPLHHLFATRPANLPFNNPHIADVNAWPWLAVASVGDTPDAIFHIPRLLYHRRNGATTPVHGDAQQSCDAVLAPELHRTFTDNGDTLLAWANPSEWPKVSLLIPTRDHVELLQSCIESLLKTDYPALEIIVMDNDSAEPNALAYLDQLNTKHVKVIPYPGAFNFSAINNHAVEHVSGSIIGLINNDIEATDPGWLKAMVRHLSRPNVGAVGAKLLWPNGMVQHAGVILGLHGLVGHTGNDWHNDDPGYFGYNQISRSASAVTAACLLCKREDYLAVGGLDEKDFPVNFNDVDFCLKLRSIGRRIVWTPEARLLHAESASRGRDRTPDRKGRAGRERSRLMQKWSQWITDDPYYNPNLNLDGYSYLGLAFPPRGRALHPPSASNSGRLVSTPAVEGVEIQKQKFEQRKV